MISYETANINQTECLLRGTVFPQGGVDPVYQEQAVLPCLAIL